MSDRPPEPKTWNSSDDAERLLAEMREQIDEMKARVRIYRAVLVGDEVRPEEAPEAADR